MVTLNAMQLRKLERALGHIKGGVQKAMAGAINRTLNKGRTEVKREIRKIYEIKAKDIPVRVRGANVAQPKGEIIIRDKMLDLNKFKVQPKGVQRLRKKRMIKATVRRGKGGFIPHGFVAGVPSGYIGPFTRVGKARLPIRKRIAIGAPIMASQPNVGPAVNKAMGDTLAKAMDQQIKRVMAGA
jgi:hypothetical protein